MFLKVLASIWFGPKICGNLKNKVQILESRWNVLQVLVFFQPFQYWCGEHTNTYFLVNEVFCHN
jgi:hypothetical protein